MTSEPSQSVGYYHVHHQGVGQEDIFIAQIDYYYFLSILSRYLVKKPVVKSTGGFYPNFYDSLELVCYSLQPTMFDLILYQSHADSISELMRHAITTYTSYFNAKYRHKGPIFDGKYALTSVALADISTVSCAIYMKSPDWTAYPHSSLHLLRLNDYPGFLRPSRLIANFKSVDEYIDHLERSIDTVA